MWLYCAILIALSVPTDVHADRKQYGAERLKQLQQTDDEKPRYHRIGTFTDTNERTEEKKKVILVVKVVKMCQKKLPCRPMIWRQREGKQTTQYELHNCSCGKAKQIAAAKAKQQEQQEERIRQERRKKEKLARENECWEVKRRARLRQVALQNQIERIRYQHIRSIQHYRRCRHSCCRNYRYRYGH
ncbi:MAG: hypothetical protein ACXAC5_01830 [Promethearchaeota archaeon]|jgi:hypothetical protein